jgi:hypothetical protein
MKQRVEWDDKSFRDFKEADWYLNQNFYDHIRQHDRNSVPFRYTYNIDTPQSDPSFYVGRLRKYYEHFSMRVLGASWEKAKAIAMDPVFILAEALNNVFEHGGGHDKKGNIAVEHYHPPNPSRLLMRVSFPEGEPWDYESQVKKYLKFRSTGELIEAGIGRGGFVTFSGRHYLVSYENEGKDLLALMTLKES